MNTNTNTNTNKEQPAVDWDSERQLLSSLAKLQELESKARFVCSLLDFQCNFSS